MSAPSLSTSITIVRALVRLFPVEHPATSAWLDGGHKPRRHDGNNARGQVGGRPNKEVGAPQGRDVRPEPPGHSKAPRVTPENVRRTPILPRGVDGPIAAKEFSQENRDLELDWEAEQRLVAEMASAAGFADYQSGTLFSLLTLMSSARSSDGGEVHVEIVIPRMQGAGYILLAASRPFNIKTYYRLERRALSPVLIAAFVEFALASGTV